MLVRSFSTSSAVPKPLITILLPALAKTRANARPIPVVEPVMTAVLPRRSGIFVPCVAFSHQIRSDDRSNAMDRCEHSTNSLAFVDPDQADRDALLKVSPVTEIRAIAFLIRPSCGGSEPVKKTGSYSLKGAQQRLVAQSMHQSRQMDKRDWPRGCEIAPVQF